MESLFADTVSMSDALRVWDLLLTLDARFVPFLCVAVLRQVRGAAWRREGGGWRRECGDRGSPFQCEGALVGGCADVEQPSTPLVRWGTTHHGALRTPSAASMSACGRGWVRVGACVLLCGFVKTAQARGRFLSARDFNEQLMVLMSVKSPGRTVPSTFLEPIRCVLGCKPVSLAIAGGRVWDPAQPA
jgi:hypothetical protein